MAAAKTRQPATDVERALAAARGDGAQAVMSAARKLCRKHLEKAVAAFKRDDYGKAAIKAAEAADADPSCGQAFHVLGLSLEHMGEMAKAVEMYEKAFALDPDDHDLYLHLGLAAWKMGLLDGAERAFRLFAQAEPGQPMGWNNLASVLKDQSRFDEAIETCREAILRMPEQPLLWNTMGAIVADLARFDEAEIFYREALRLDPAYLRAWHNLGFGLHHLGRLEEALECYDKALALKPPPHERIEIEHSRGLCLLAVGDLKRGFAAYEVRHDKLHRGSMYFAIPEPRWAGQDVSGKTLLVVGEQGLGDEVMFAGVLPDLVERVGPEGRVLCAVDYRLIPLLSRSMPQVKFGPYQLSSLNAKDVRHVNWAVGADKPDYWVPMGGAVAAERGAVADFPARAFLTPDHARVAEHRRRLEAKGGRLIVGLCWRSMVLTAQRRKYYSAIDAWGPILKTPGATFVNLQYGDCAEEIARAEALFGVRIETAESLDLKKDLDGACALSAACDLVVSAPTAAAALAAGAGVETWFLVAAAGWPQLGTDRYPWYPRTRALAPAAFGDWAELMPRVAAEIEAFAAGR